MLHSNQTSCMLASNQAYNDDDNDDNDGGDGNDDDVYLNRLFVNCC
jgi:hypothetical protein